MNVAPTAVGSDKPKTAVAFGPDYRRRIPGSDCSGRAGDAVRRAGPCDSARQPVLCGSGGLRRERDIRLVRTGHSLFSSRLKPRAIDQAGEPDLICCPLDGVSDRHGLLLSNLKVRNRGPRVAAHPIRHLVTRAPRPSVNQKIQQFSTDVVPQLGARPGRHPPAVASPKLPRQSCMAEAHYPQCSRKRERLGGSGDAYGLNRARTGEDSRVRARAETLP
jgi:hypothetical protein